MISAVSAAPTSDDVVSEDAGDVVVAESILDETSNVQNSHSNDEIISENGGAANVLAAGDKDSNTTISALNMSFSRSKVLDGDAVYPILLTSSSFPYILNNKTINVEFNNDIKDLKTVYGYANYTLPVNTPVGKYPIKMKFDGGDGYSGSELTSFIEVKDVATQIMAESNASFTHPSVLDESAHYYIVLATNATIPSLLANRTVSVTFKQNTSKYTTNAVGLIDYIIPKDTAAGIETIKIEYAGEEGYIGSTFTTDIEIYDVATQIIALKNVSYSYKDVLNGKANYPFYLATNSTIPLPVANKTVTIFVKGVGDDIITNGLGIGNYVISNITKPGHGSVEIEYKGGDGYLGCKFTTDVDIYETQTQIIALEEMSYSLPTVVSGAAHYPFALATNSTIPLPLANRSVIVEFDNFERNFTTGALGIIDFVIPNDTDEGIYPIEITYAGEDGYDPCHFRGYIEVYEVDTQIIALGNTSYAHAAVADGLGYYPFILATNSTIPLPLANRTVFVTFGNGKFNYTTNVIGLVNFVIPNGTVAGTYPIEIAFVGDDAYDGVIFNANIEVYDIETQIIALENASYATPIVIGGLGYYPFVLATNSTIPAPLANTTVTVLFNKVLTNYTTNAIGLVNFVIPNTTVAGSYPIDIFYVSSDEGYFSTDFHGTIEVYDVGSQIAALSNVSYATPTVVSGNAYYPIVLVTNSTIPLPLANRTISIEFNGVKEDYITNALGLVNFVIPNSTAKGVYPIKISFAGEEGVEATVFNGNITIEDLETQIIAVKEMSYPIPFVVEGLAYYPFVLATNSTIPIPLANKTVSIEFNGTKLDVTTGVLGIVNFVIPNTTDIGSYPIKITYAGEEGIQGTVFEGTVNVEEVGSQITALGNMSYSTPLVFEGLAYYPIALTTNDIIPLPLANRTVSIAFNKVKNNYTTNALGLINFVIPEGTVAGTYTIDIVYAGDDLYAGSTYSANIEIYDVETTIIAIQNASYSRPLVAQGNAIYPIFLATNTTIPVPIANKTVFIECNGVSGYYTTDALGLINYIIPNTTIAGEYPIKIKFEGYDGYIASNFTGMVEVYDVETQVIALGNVSYPLPVVVKGDAIYPILLATNTTIPIPLANKTIGVVFEGADFELTTNALGIANFVIPEILPEGNYTMKIVYPGEDGYIDSSIEVNVEIVTVATSIIAAKNVSYSTYEVFNDLAIYPILLVGDGIIPIPLANRTVIVEFNGVGGELTTNALGMINFHIDAPVGNHTIKIFYDGTEDGYLDSVFTTNVEIYDSESQIIALNNLTYSYRSVVDGKAIYPILLATNTTIPIPLANREVYVEFNGTRDVYTTNALGIILFTIPDTVPGTYKILMAFDGDNEFAPATKETTINIVKSLPEASVNVAVAVDTEPGIVTVIVTSNVDGECLITVGDEMIPVEVVDGLAYATFDDIAAGTQTATVKFPANGKYDELIIDEEFTINPSTEKTKSIIAITGFAGNNITGVLMDENGDPIEGAEIEYTADGQNKSVVTGEDGSFVIEAAVGSPTTISYAGDDETAPINITIEVDAPVPVIVKVATNFNIPNGQMTIKGYAVDTKAGEEGIYYATELLDADGKPIAGADIKFALNDKVYLRTTNENGSFDPYKLNMIKAQKYTIAFYYGGSEKYNSTFASVCADLAKKPITIKASDKSYKVSTKTKSYTISVSTIVGSSHDGKAHLRTGLKLTLTVNGKTFTGKTDSNGKVTFKINNLSKKGKYTAKIKYDGDITYESASKTVKITAK